MITGAAKLNFNLDTGNDRLDIRRFSFQQVRLNVRGGPGMDRVWLTDNTIAGPGKLAVDLGTGMNTFFSRRNRLGKQVVLKAEPPAAP